MDNVKWTTALAALELVVRGVLECEPSDSVLITANPSDYSVSAISIKRGEQEFPILNHQLINVNERLHLIGTHFINAAQNFLLETLEVRLRGQRRSVERLIASGMELKMDLWFHNDNDHSEALKRLYPNS